LTSMYAAFAISGICAGFISMLKEGLEVPVGYLVSVQVLHGLSYLKHDVYCNMKLENLLPRAA
jgi:hypothetical protein